MPRLSVIMPAYNEASTARAALEAVVAKEIAGLEIEIIVIESNSTDGTREIVLGYRGHPRVKLILEDAPRGKGRAVRAGFAAATGDVLLIQDADLEYDLADYEKVLAPILDRRALFVLGCRRGKGGGAMRQMENEPVRSFVLNFGHWSLTSLINAVLGTRLKDPFTMYKVFRRECLAGLSFECDGFDFDSELLIKLVRKGYRPIEVPVSYRSRSFKEGKKVRIWHDSFAHLRALIKYRLTAT